MKHHGQTVVQHRDVVSRWCEFSIQKMRTLCWCTTQVLWPQASVYVSCVWIGNQYCVSVDDLLALMNEEGRGCVWQRCVHFLKCQLVWQNHLSTINLHICSNFAAWLRVRLSHCLWVSWETCLVLVCSWMKRRCCCYFLLWPTGVVVSYPAHSSEMFSLWVPDHHWAMEGRKGGSRESNEWIK